jgi:magnesium transporter
MIRSINRTGKGEVKENIPFENYYSALQDSKGLLWVDIYDEPNQNIKAILDDTFRFHPLAVADALDEVHVPKIDDWGDYLYIVLRAIIMEDNQEQQLDTQEIDIFLGTNYFITYHDQLIPAIERIWERHHRDQHLPRIKADQLLYKLVDEIATDFISFAETIDEMINQIEDQLFDNPKPVLMEKVFSLKRDLLHLRRMIAPQREVINKLARGDYKIIDPESRMYFRDGYDHFSRLYEIVENLRDLIGSALEIYLSIVNNRMNNVMKTLTVITTLFMPISFLASFFGMNFFQPVAHFDLWTGAIVFRFLLFAMILFPIGMYFWIKKRGWIE